MNKKFLLLTSCFSLLILFAGCGHRPPTLSDTHLRAVEFNQKAESAFKKGDYQRALYFYNEALRVNYSVENNDGIATNLINMAIVYRRLGDGDNAHRCVDEILDESQAAHYTSRLFEAALVKAMLYMDAARYDAASEWADKALSFCQSARCPVEGKIYNLKGRIALLKEEPASALTFGTRALTLNKTNEDEEEVANSLRLLAEANVKRGEYEEARKLYEDALVIDKSLGLSRKVAIDLMGIGNTLLKQDKPKEALEYYQRALSVNRGAGDIEGIKDATTMVEKCLRDLGRK